MTMCTVQSNDINTYMLQCSHTIHKISGNANTCANQQSSELIFYSIGKTFEL